MLFLSPNKGVIMLEITITIKNDEDKPEGFIMAIDPMTLCLYRDLHGKEPYTYILETVHMALNTSINTAAVKMKELVDKAVEAVPKEEIVAQIAKATKEKGE